MRINCEQTNGKNRHRSTNIIWDREPIFSSTFAQYGDNTVFPIYIFFFRAKISPA